jgi:hypothetical protein
MEKNKNLYARNITRVRQFKRLLLLTALDQCHLSSLRTCELFNESTWLSSSEEEASLPILLWLVKAAAAFAAMQLTQRSCLTGYCPLWDKLGVISSGVEALLLSSSAELSNSLCTTKTTVGIDLSFAGVAPTFDKLEGLADLRVVAAANNRSVPDGRRSPPRGSRARG